MATAPRRREKRLDHLNAATVPVERALLELADQNTEMAAEAPADSVDEIVAKTLADHCRKLAENLHWHG